MALLHRLVNVSVVSFGLLLCGCPDKASSHSPGDGHDHGAAPVHSEGDGHDHIEGFNEHVWYDPHTVEDLANDIAEHLGELAPDHAADFTANADAFARDQVERLLSKQNGPTEKVGAIRETLQFEMFDKAGVVRNAQGLQQMSAILADLQARYQRVAIDEAVNTAARQEIPVLALDAALGRLETVDRGLARIVELRAFGGLTIEEAAHVLNVSASTAKREWRTAKAWLTRELGAEELP